MDFEPVYLGDLRLHRPENRVYQGKICFGYFPALPDLQVYLNNGAWLHPQEQTYADSLKFEKRKKSYLLGRLTAKCAVAALLGEKPADIWIQSGIFTQPLVVANASNVQVSITHCDDFGAALAFPEAHPMGIDLERVAPDKKEALERNLTKAEKELMKAWPYPYETGLTLVWTAKEAISKVLKTGLMAPLEIFEITKSELHPNYILSHYQNFHQYKVLSFPLGEYICSLVVPFKTELDIEVNAIQTYFATGTEQQEQALD